MVATCLWSPWVTPVGPGSSWLLLAPNAGWGPLLESFQFLTDVDFSDGVHLCPASPMFTLTFRQTFQGPYKGPHRAFQISPAVYLAESEALLSFESYGLGLRAQKCVVSLHCLMQEHSDKQKW